MRIIKTLFLALCGHFVATTAFAQPGNFHDSRDKVTVSVEVAPNQTTPSGDVVLAVILQHELHWHTHTNNPEVPEVLGSAEDYIATALHFELPEDSPLSIHEGYIQWPDILMVSVGFTGVPVEYGVFSGTSVIYVPVTVSAEAELGIATFKIRPVFQVCDDTVCLQPTPTQDMGSMWDEYGITVELDIVDLATVSSSTPSSTYDQFDSSVFSKIHDGVKATSDTIVKFDLFGLKFDLDTGGSFDFNLLLLVAMLGGFLLNLTPCVLPVIPIKIMGLSAHAGNRRKTLFLGIWMMLGVMSLWVGLGAAIALVSEFTAINQLFQYPAFTIVLGIFIGIMAIGMGGLFSIRLPNFVYAVNPKQDSWYGSFLFGIMTAILSTPCTAPFMGAAALWAAKQEPVLTLTVFGAIGFGMAIPYLILAAFPQLVEKIPKVGAASEVVKQVMGLLMLAAALYFLGVGLCGVLQQEGAPPSRLYLWFVAASVASAGAWMAWRAIQLAGESSKGKCFIGLGTLIVIASIYGGFRLTDPGPINWEYYTPEILEESLAEGDIVVLEFTAEWCLNCKFLETTVLHNELVVAAFEEDDVTPIKVDLTGNNVAGNALLNEVGLGIPLLIILAPDGEEVFRGDFYTVSQVLDAIQTSRADE